MRFAFFATACACLCVACRSTKPAPAQAPLEPIIPVPDAPLEWSPPEPDESADDWIRLVSGEWLRGEIEVMRRDSLEFDSNELDTLTIDWEDIPEVRTTRTMTLGLTEGRVVTGTLMVKDGKVAVRSAQVVHFDREELLSIIPGTPSEMNYWSGKISLGTTVRRGNTNQTDSTAALRVLRRSPSSRTELTYNGALSRVNSEETANSNRVNGRWDRFISKRFYVSPLFFEAMQDHFQNLDLRFTPGSGVGYQIVDRSGLEWDVDSGIGYQLVKYDSVEVGEAEEVDSWAALLGTTLSTDLTKKIELLFDYRVQAAFKSEVGTNQHASLTLSVDVVSDIDLDVSAIWDRVGKPVADSDGVTPKNDDYRLQVGFGWSF